MGLRILVVDAQPQVREMFQSALGGRGHRVLCAPDGQQALFLAHQGAFQLVVVDPQLDNGDGMAILAELKRLQPAASCIVITSHPGLMGGALSLGVGLCLAKPIGERELLDLVEMVEGAPEPDPA